MKKGFRLFAFLFVGTWIGICEAASKIKPPVMMAEAPREGMLTGSWSSGNKEIFGTAFEAYDAENKYTKFSPTAPISKVWFTGAHGILTEIYWPTIDRPQVKDSQFMVSDGKSFVWKENDTSDYKIEWMEEGVPAFKTTTQDSRGRFRIERITFTEPNSSVLLQKIKIIKNVPGLHFYYLHNPSVGNSPLSDTSFVDDKVGSAGLYAFQGNEAQALVFSIPLKQVSSGFEGANDGYQDLVSDFSMDARFQWARNGNVVNTAWLELSDEVGSVEFTMALGFGATLEGAYQVAVKSLDQTEASLRTYLAQWKTYQSSLNNLGVSALDNGLLFRRSSALLKSMEDKTYEGAFVASPSNPWGQHTVDATSIEDNKGQVGGYHLVWPRDLYQMATTFLALGDTKSSVASLNYLKRIQFGAGDGDWVFGFRRAARNGSFTQNCWVDGTPYWSSLQMDQTSFPVILAYRLWKKEVIELKDYWDMVRRAADFITQMGPWSAQERWEENFGASPSTIASQIAALWVASEMATAMGDAVRAERYRHTGDQWSSKPGDNLEAWTFTTTGGLGNGKYYIRIEGAARLDQYWNPNDDDTFLIQNPGGKRVREKDVVDGGFLELVRLGVRTAWDYHVSETLHEYDKYIRVDTVKGTSFHRYLGDRYNYDDSSGKNTAGMLWPLLTGERGMFEHEKMIESGNDPQLADQALVPYLSAMERFSTSTGMIPEQVWNGGSHEGLPTGAASPLGWAHGEYIKLLAARRYKRSPDILLSVKQRSLQLDIIRASSGRP